MLNAVHYLLLRHFIISIKWTCLKAWANTENDIGRVCCTGCTLPVVRRLVTTFLTEVYNRVQEWGTTSSTTSSSLVPSQSRSLRYITEPNVLTLRPALLAHLHSSHYMNHHETLLCHLEDELRHHSVNMNVFITSIPCCHLDLSLPTSNQVISRG